MAPKASSTSVAAKRLAGSEANAETVRSSRTRLNPAEHRVPVFETLPLTLAHVPCLCRRLSVGRTRPSSSTAESKLF